MKNVIVAVLAHPDDESFGMGGTLARYAAQRVAVHVVLATRGEAGIPGVEPVRAGARREAEARAACATLGVRSLRFLDYLDGRLAQIEDTAAVERLTGQLRLLQPAAVLTFGPDGISGHPDHIAVGRWTDLAFERLRAEPDGPRLLYTLAPSEATQQACGGPPSAEAVGGPVAFIDVGPYLVVKMQAMQQHRSQQQPYTGAPEVEAARLACHEVFRLARWTDVAAPAGPITDLMFGQETAPDIPHTESASPMQMTSLTMEIQDERDV